MAVFTLGTASQATGCAKSTILRSIRAGRLSASRDDGTKEWRIDPAELFRVFPPLAVPGLAPMERDATDPTTDILVTELRAVIADLRRNQEDLRTERDKWQAAHQREQAAHAATQRLLLPAPAPASERDATPPEPAAAVTERDATAPGPAAPAGEAPRKGWRWWRRAAG